MSLAPASSRGAFLKARLAVNGIQCAARSLGTLTAAGRGLLSSMGPLQELGVADLAGGYQFRAMTETGISGALFQLNPAISGIEVGGGDPEYLAVGFLGFE